MVASVRPAREADLAELFRIQLRALGFEHLLDRYGPDHVTPLIRHGFEQGETLVAEVEGSLAGLAVGYERDGTWFLGEFFVLPELQQGGIGQQLLAAIVPDGIPVATISTDDLRAQALYTRAGMTPRRPSYSLEADATAISLPPTGLHVRDTDLDDAAWVDWDRKICGRDRRQELDFHAGPWNGLRFWVERDGKRVGYGGYTRRAAGRATIGPVGALRIDDSAACLIAMVHRALQEPGVTEVMFDVPGPHPALPSLLAGGFKIDELNVFCASDPDPFGDPRRYVPLSAALC